MQTVAVVAGGRRRGYTWEGRGEPLKSVAKYCADKGTDLALRFPSLKSSAASKLVFTILRLAISAMVSASRVSRFIIYIVPSFHMDSRGVK